MSDYDVPIAIPVQQASRECVVLVFPLLDLQRCNM